ncbi:hypothetical protein [Streptomyces brevispora]|uniref:hypothetical protein n=1 Tax=Streptomyces brevispora TaxID=887462 RepID=UPI0039A761D8
MSGSGSLPAISDPHVAIDDNRAVVEGLRPDHPDHFPLVREPTRVLRHPEFALWRGTRATADRPTRFDARATVYEHPRIPRTPRYDGVRFEEVSVGHPREWRGNGPGGPRLVLPGPDAAARVGGPEVLR